MTVKSRTKKTKSDKTTSTMERLEQRIAMRSSELEGGAETHQRMKESAKTAKAFARNVAGGDKVKFIQAFQVAFNIAAGAKVTHPDEPAVVRRALRNEGGMAPQRFFTDQTYVENAVKLIQDQERIVGGVPTNEFPDCVAVGNDNMWCCTGTLVAPNVVLTAGHCGGVCSSRIFIGPNVNGQGTVVKVSKAVRHPKYHQGGIHNDLTVLILKKNVKDVKPREIAPSALIDAAISILAVGYGNSDTQSTTGYGIKRKVDLPVASASCSTVDAQTKYGCDGGLELVAGAPLLNKDSCNGDSGGPVYVQNKEKTKWYLAGATSRAVIGSVNPCGDGGIYARIDRYIEWIRSVPGGHWA